MLFEKLPNEKWKDVPTYEGLYQISSLGRVYGCKSAKFLRPDSHKNVKLAKYENGRRVEKSWLVHVLIACAFIGLDINDEYRHRVMFSDGDSSNVILNNLYIEDTSDLPNEEWRDIEYSNGRKLKPYYKVSNYGRIKSIAHKQEWMNYGKLSTKHVPEMLLSVVPSKDKYRYVWLIAEDKEINAQVHRLVATAFCENDDPEHKTQVNHIDGNPSNNNAYNLEWVTPSENMNHAIKYGLKTKFHKTLRYPVRRIETDQVFASITEVEEAMGRAHGYVYTMVSDGHVCRDINGNVWTLEIMKDVYQYIPGEGQHCYFEEHPERVYISMTEASKDIGRWDGYVQEAVKRNGSITNKYTGEKLHIKFVD